MADDDRDDNFANVDFHVVYVGNPAVQQLLNDSFSGIFPDQAKQRMFRQPGADGRPAASSSVIDNAQLQGILPALIAQYMIAPSAVLTDTADDANLTGTTRVILDQLRHCPIKLQLKGRYLMDLTTANLLRCLRQAQRDDVEIVTIVVNVAPLNFDRAGLLQDWNLIALDTPEFAFVQEDNQPDTNAPQVQPDPVASLATAIATATGNLENVVREAMAGAAQAGAAAGVRNAAAAAAAANNQGNRHAGNANTTADGSPVDPALVGLPANYNDWIPEAQERHDHLIEQGILTRAEMDTPYPDGRLYWSPNIHLVVQADGSVYGYLATQDHKAWAKAFEGIVWTDFSKQGRFKLYDLIYKKALAFGIYVLPFWLHRLNRGPRGFTLGDGATDSLPALYNQGVTRFNQLIFDALEKITYRGEQGDVFRAILNANTNEGYICLKMLILPMHPAFIENAAEGITEYPLQEPGEQIVTFIEQFVFHLQMATFIHNDLRLLTDSTYLDIFLSRLQHSTYIKRETRRDRQDPTQAHRFELQNLAETLMLILQQSDSPALVTTNVVTTVTLPTNRDDVDAYVRAVDIEAPPGENPEVLDVYRVAVGRLRDNPAAIEAPECICCDNGERHRFENCPLLQDVTYLRNHLIAFSQLIRRLAANRRRDNNARGGAGAPNRRLRGPPAIPARAAARGNQGFRGDNRGNNRRDDRQVQVIDAADDAVEEEELVEEPVIAQDFQQGRGPRV
jgi:hypothetical protein